MPDASMMLAVGTAVGAVVAFFVGMRSMLTKLDGKAAAREAMAAQRHSQMLECLTGLRASAEAHGKLLNELIVLVRVLTKDSTKEHERLMEYMKEADKAHIAAHKEIRDMVADATAQMGSKR